MNHKISPHKKAVTAGKTRILAVGDRKQSIYRFRGVSDAFPELKSQLGLNQSFGLTSCFRCPMTHIELAQRIVADIKAAPSAQQGTIMEEVLFETAIRDVRPGDLVIARSNAALVKFAFTLVRKGVSSKIIGEEYLRDTLEETVKKHISLSSEELLSILTREERNVKGQLFATGNSREAPFVQEMYQLIREHAMKKPTAKVEAILKDIKTIFDGRGAHNSAWEENAVLCSSVHRAKGLTRTRTWILADSWLQDLKKNSVKFPINAEEEEHLLYIAVTRAKEAISFVDGSFEKIFKAIAETKK